MPLEPFFTILNLIGIFVFALSGSIAAARKKMDLYGSLVLALATSFGGGIIRDILLGIFPPAAFSDTAAVIVSIIGTVTVFFLFKQLETFNNSLRIMDAIGLGVFTIIGVAIALDHKTSSFTAIFLGIITGTGGGMIRDILSQEVPMVLQKEIYAVASLSGAVLYIFLIKLGVPAVYSAVISSISITAIRLISIKMNWNFPGASLRRNN